MIGYPSKVLIVSDYPGAHFTDHVGGTVDFVLSCGDVEFLILQEIHDLFKKPIFAVKGNHDTTKPFPPFVTDVNLRLAQCRNWIIGGLEGVPVLKSAGHYQWDDMAVMEKLEHFPCVDIFICHAPVIGLTDGEDSVHGGSEAILRYIHSKQPQYVYHGHVHAEMGTVVGRSSVVSVFGARLVTLEYEAL